VLEPCGYNPLIALHALSQRVERLELRSNGRYLRKLLSARLEVVELHHYQALPIHRLVFHPELGRPGLARNALVQRLTARFEGLAAFIMPRWAWAYVHVRAVLGRAT
jgi:hypothetical protein